MFNVYLFQPQFAADIRNETNYWLPYSVGCLWSYARQFDFVKENFVLKDLIFRRENPADIINRLENPTLCGFSCYVWNRNYCLLVAEQIKQKWPNCTIVFGGPQASTKMLDLKFIDSVVLAEGEESFVKILSAIQENRKVETVYLKNRLLSLDIPSPYTSGVFDSIIQNNPKALWAMVLETNRGCPYACTFCDWGSTTYSKVKKFSLEHVRADLEWATKNRVGFLFCADANFGVFKERDLEIARMIKETSEQGILEMVNIQYAKNSNNTVFEIARTFGDLSRGITFSVQSMNKSTLEAIKRTNMDVNDLKSMLELGHQYGVGTYTEVILGLPEETLESWKSGLTEILELGQHESIDIWFCQLLENSDLNSLESKLKYGIKTITANDYVPFSNKDDYTGINEEIMLVQSTNSMSVTDMVEAYMYGWMIIHFHISGYTQYMSKYARHILNISYRQFYDELYARLKNSNFFESHVQSLRTSITNYLLTGDLNGTDTIPRPLQVDTNKIRGSLSGIDSFKFLYDNKNKCFDIGVECLKTFTKDVAQIDLLQRHFIYDCNVAFPIEIETPWDLRIGALDTTKCVINPKFLPTNEFDFYLARKKGLLKNHIEFYPK